MMYVQFTISGTKYRYELAEGVIINFEALPTTDNIEDVWDSGAWVAFVGTIDLTNVTSYQLQIISQDNVPLSQVYDIQLYSECDVHERVDICFLDRLGSWVTVTFNKAYYVSQSVERSEYRRKTPLNYTALNAGMESFHNEERLSYRVNSGQLSESEYFYLRELISTPKAFVSFNQQPFQAIRITNNNLELLKQRTSKQRNLQVEFEMATQDEING